MEQFDLPPIVNAILNVVKAVVGRGGRNEPLTQVREPVIDQNGRIVTTQDVLSLPHQTKLNAENAAAMMQGPSERQRVILESRKLFDSNPVVDALISTASMDITRGEYAVQFDPAGIDSARAQEITDDFIKNMGLNQDSYSWCLNTKIDGDFFLEVVIDSRSRQIISISPFETLDIKPVLNNRGNFVNRSKAFKVEEYGSMAGGNIAFYPLMLVVWAKNKPMKSPRNPYGRPEFRSAIGSLRRAGRGWDDMAIRRAMSGGKTRVHTLSNLDALTLAAYQEANKETLNISFDNLSSILDVFTTTSGSEGYREYQGDATLDRIGDVLHHIDTGAIVSMTPLELIGYSRGINRDILEQKSKQYAQAVADGVKWFGNQFIEPLVDRHLLLNGINPPNTPYQIIRKHTAAMTPAELIAVGQAVSALRGSMVIGDSLILKIVSALLPGVSLEDLQAAYALEIAPPFPDQVDRMANLSTAPADDGEDDDQETDV